ncbi:purine nucleoside phosphorylase [Clostridia bacterium]|nr:purine nucleoside phosphorylase [Clostridia bacterium]
MYRFDDYADSVRFIQKESGGFEPEAALVLGSGLGFLGDLISDPCILDYADIPNFKVSAAPGHKGRLVLGKLAGKKVAVMQGRVHCYEGHSPEEVAFPVRALNKLGAGSLIITNACGGINTAFDVGDIMLIRDHIALFGVSPLKGPNLGEFGVRFPDMSVAYTPALCEVARAAARELDCPIREGVYMYFPGPQYETPAEIRAARALGADTAGMSTVPEVIAARHAGMDILGFSLVCNMASGVLDVRLTEEDVLAAAAEARPRFSALVLKCLENM